MEIPFSPEAIPTTEVISRRRKTPLDYACIVFQALVIIAFIILIIAASGEKKKIFHQNESVMYVIFVMIYIVYLVLEFCSTSCSYLIHKVSSVGIYDKMYRLVSTHPEIIFHCETFHYEYRQDYNNRGNNRGSTKTKVVTYREDYSMPYYSSRDVSGLFVLNCDKNLVQNKAYIQLELLAEINFADNITYMDYEAVRSDFYMKNRPRDYYMTYYEKRIIPGLTQYNLIKIADNEPFYVNILFFILSAIFICAEFYKCYVDKLCVPQRFSVRKIISTRYDLNAPQIQERYRYFTPSIDLHNNQYAYQSQDFNYLNNEYELDLPTKEDIEKAQQYSDKIPDYQIDDQTYTSINGEIKVGVVKNDPSYCSANYSEAIPPGCLEKDKQYIDEFAKKYGEQGIIKYPSLN
jgi:hypothetical protein